MENKELNIQKIDSEKLMQEYIEKFEQFVESKKGGTEDYSKEFDNFKAFAKTIKDYNDSISKQHEDMNKTVEEFKELAGVIKENMENYYYDPMKDIDFTGYALKNNLKKILKDKRIKQIELAEKINISKGTMSNLLNNKHQTSLELAFKISKVLDMPINDIFQFEDFKKDIE